jgi:hypothetical protein
VDDFPVDDFPVDGFLAGVDAVCAGVVETSAASNVSVPGVVETGACAAVDEVLALDPQPATAAATTSAAITL